MPQRLPAVVGDALSPGDGERVLAAARGREPVEHADGGTTDLTGLTTDEARALFLVAVPSSSATPEVRSALRKLMRALPEPFRVSAERASRAVVVDPARWGGDRDTRPPRRSSTPSSRR